MFIRVSNGYVRRSGNSVKVGKGLKTNIDTLLKTLSSMQIKDSSSKKKSKSSKPTLVKKYIKF